jgi:hypothetical protein
MVSAGTFRNEVELKDDGDTSVYRYYANGVILSVVYGKRTTELFKLKNK